MILRLFLLCLFLSSCGVSKPTTTSLTPLYQNGTDLSDEALFLAVDAFLKAKNAPLHSTYDFERIDLNDDGKREGIILFKTPHRHWCGWDGCKMVIFEQRRKKFMPQSLINSIRPPVMISPNTTHGWHDVIIRVSGINIPDKDIVMQYNQNTGQYPHSPLIAPTIYDVPDSIVKIFRY